MTKDEANLTAIASMFIGIAFNDLRGCEKAIVGRYLIDYVYVDANGVVKKK